MNTRLKNYLKRYNVPVQEGIAVDNVMAAEEAYRQIKNDTGNNFAVVKAQIHAGGRGKGKIEVKNNEVLLLVKVLKMLPILQRIFWVVHLVTIQTGPAGKKVNKILIAQDVYYPGPNPVKEFYLSILLTELKVKM